MKLRTDSVQDTHYLDCCSDFLAKLMDIVTVAITFLNAK